MLPQAAENTTAAAAAPSRAEDYSSGRLTPFLVYVVTFHLAWVAWPYVVYPRLVAIGDATLAYALLNVGLRLLIWVLPVLLYLRYVDGVEPFGYLALRRHVGRGVAVAAAVTALNLL